MTHNFDEFVDRRNTDSKKYAPDFYPVDVIPMWIADTDFRCPQPVVESMVERAQHGVYGYPYDQASFSNAVCHWMSTRHNYDFAPEAVVYCPGVIPGVIAAVRAFSDAGDSIVVQTPCYPPFRALVQNNGRKLIENRLVLKDGRYEIDFERLENQLKEPRTRVLLLSSPHNPTGRVFTRAELEMMLALCVANDVLIICDEIHCDLAYGAHKHISFGSLSETARKNSIVFINPSKTFNTAGLRTAAMISPDERLRNRVYQQLVNGKIFGRTLFGTLALEVSYNECAYYADELVQYLTKNLALLRERLADMPKIKLVEPEATYLMWIDCRELNLAQEELNRFFTDEAKVGLNDGVSFGVEGAGFMRLNIACTRAVLEDGISRIKKAYDRKFK